MGRRRIYKKGNRKCEVKILKEKEGEDTKNVR